MSSSTEPTGPEAVVLVEHHLAAGMHSRFDDWLERTGLRLADWPGFLSLERLTVTDRPERYHLLLRFESVRELRAWSSSPAHEEALAELEDEMLKKQSSTVFTARSVSRTDL